MLCRHAIVLVFRCPAQTGQWKQWRRPYFSLNSKFGQEFGYSSLILSHKRRTLARKVAVAFDNLVDYHDN